MGLIGGPIGLVHPVHPVYPVSLAKSLEPSSRQVVSEYPVPRDTSV